MQLELEQIKKIREYFEPIYGVRCNDWVVEMRRQISMMLLDNGIGSVKISKVICMSYCVVSHYKNRMKPTPSYIEKEVKKNLFKWIESKQYPLIVYKDGADNEYVLSETPPLRNKANAYKSVRNRRSDIDRFIDSL